MKTFVLMKWMLLKMTLLMHWTVKMCILTLIHISKNIHSYILDIVTMSVIV